MCVSITSLQRCSLTYNFLVLPVTDSCFVPEPSFARILIPSPSNLLSIHFTTQNSTSCLDHQRMKWLRHGVIHSSPNTNSVVMYRTTNHVKSIDDDKALVSFWAGSTTCYQEFCDSEHVPGWFSAYKYKLCDSSFAHDLGSTNVLGSKWPPLDCHLPRNFEISLV